MVQHARKAPEYWFAETDGQVYLVQERGTWRFPRTDQRLPFPHAETARMDFGTEVVRRVKPELSRHPEEWFQRDELFSRDDVDGLVKKAVYMTMPRLVAEAVFVRAGEVLMEKASRGFSKGHWNLPGGFLEFGERPEKAARREAEEELGVRVEIDRSLGIYHSSFPGKPTFTIGFVYRGTLQSESFRLKGDEIERVDWLRVEEALESTRNPFAKWALVEAYRQGDLPEIDVRRHLPPTKVRPASGPVVFLDRDGTINRDREGAVRTPSQFEFNAGVKGALRTLAGLGYRLAVITNQDAVAWGWMTEADLRRVHAKMLRELEAARIRIENVYYCPHEAKDECACRKPRPGMLLGACKDLGVNPWEAWMVGDRPDDVLAGKAVRVLTAFVGDATRRDKYAADLADAKPDLLVATLAEFAATLKSGTFVPPWPPAYT